MNKLIFLLTFISALAFGASGTIELGPTIGGGGGGSGTVTSVDMTVPTFLSVSGNPITSAGVLAVALATQTTNKVFAAPNGSTGVPTFRALVSADIPSLSYANQTLSNLTSPTAVNQNLIMAGTNTVILPNNVALQALDNTVTARDLISIDAFNRTNIFGVGSGNILFNNNIIPAVNDALSMGVVGDPFLNIVTNIVTIGNSGASLGQIDLTSDDPLGNGANNGMAIRTNALSKNIYLFTESGTVTKSIFTETGTASAGASGNMIYHTGDATDSSGTLDLETGASSSAAGGSGGINLVSGPAVSGFTGGINLNTGIAGATAPGIAGSGPISAITGEDAGPASANGSGQIDLGTGPVTSATSTAASGSHFYVTGDVSGSGNSGDFQFIAGGVNTGHRGDLIADIRHFVLLPTTSPSMGACGTSPSVSGSDSAGAITVGTGGAATSCVLTFSSAWSAAPHCFVNYEGAIVATKAVTSTTALTISVVAPFVASSAIDYFCVSN